jgi:glyoxylase-like metal-dependent hydrolase (beta-lactamase superfamily II)/8-oxo-dGTP pyrophosphatase MutT (NUDIX family)
VSTITEAASVLLARGPGSSEVFLVARAPALRFMGGFHAFPGGKAHASDRHLAQGLSVQQVSAIRELFEETGVLLARRADGSFPPASTELANLRHALLAEEIAFADALTALGLHLAADDLAPAGSLVTPAFAPVRFDTAFFVATLPPGQEAEVWPGELTEGTWRSADEALRLWEQGQLLLSPPTVALLETIRGRPVRELPERLRPLLAHLESGALHPIWFSPAVLMLPLDCGGLPPTTHTNAYLVGTGPTYLLDPGPSSPEEQARLFAALDARPPLTAIVLTHHHPDHIGAVVATAQRYRVPVFAHPLAARALAGRIDVQREINDGDRLDLGPAPQGRGGWHLEAILTPGHAPGHLAFYEPSYKLLFAGDMVSTISSVIVAPPEGDLIVYLGSLRRLLQYPARLLLPAHGPVSARPGFVLEEALAHRAKREEQLLALLDEPRTVPDIAIEMYRGLPSNLMKWAELQVLAGLHKLEREGRAEPNGETWRARKGE